MAYNVVVLEREILLRDLLEAKDQSSSRSFGPRAGRDESGASGLILGVFEDSLEVGVGGGALDRNRITSIHESLDDGGGEGAVLEGLLLGTEKDGWVVRHVCDCDSKLRELLAA